MARDDLADLRRKQIDDRLQPFSGLPNSTPKRGWIHAVRTALGMTLEQLGKRLSMPKQGVAQLERNETRGALTLASLRAAADALDCDLVIGLSPRAGSLDAAVRAQAHRRARQLRADVKHTMELEAQSEGIDSDLAEQREAEWWMTENAGRLWDAT